MSPRGDSCAMCGLTLCGWALLDFVSASSQPSSKRHSTAPTSLHQPSAPSSPRHTPTPSTLPPDSILTSAAAMGVDDPVPQQDALAVPELPGSLHTAVLRDGRTVSYSVCGSASPDAHTVLFLHPLQGNR